MNERETQDAAHWQNQAEMWKAKAREHQNKAHTWRLLYQDLLEKIASKLDIQDGPRNG